MSSAQTKLFLEVNNDSFELPGETVQEALQNLPEIKPFTKASFTYSHDDGTKRTAQLTIQNFNRLSWPGLSGQIARSLLAKRLTL